MEKTRNPKYDELVTALTKIFQIDRPDLDFGIYRILNARAGEIQDYLKTRLFEKVQEALNSGTDAERDQAKRELAEKEAQYEADGVDPSNVPKIQELREKLAQITDGAREHENAVFSHLLTFFSRYYDHGDFISQRRYKGDTYAVPYAGEEVLLHWANKDQYYIKSGENFSNYSFKLKDGRTVHFRLMAADTAKDNRKDNNQVRRFVMAETATLTRIDNQGNEYEEEVLPVEEVEGLSGEKELIIRFQYVSMPKGTKQEALIGQAIQKVLADDCVKSRWVALGDRMPTEKNPKRTLLEKHLTTYTSKNTADYFIHKDLGGFLRRELDFYIKNEVMHLDDVENETAPRVEQYLSKIKVIRRIAHKIIDFLAQLEEFQKRLWLKKKFVVDSHYCFTLDRILSIDDENIRNQLLYQIARNDAQRKEWVKLFEINKIQADIAEPGYSEPLTVEFLKSHPHLVVDTAHFSSEFTESFLAASASIDSSINGVFIYSDSFHGLNLIRARYASQVQCIYIDPPFNTESDGFAYKDAYEHSSWLAMMADRLTLAKELLIENGTLYCHIDYNEKERLKLLLDEHLEYITEIIWRIGWVSGYKSAANKFIRNHDTIYQYGKSNQPLFIKTYIPYPEGYTRRDGSLPAGKGYPLEDTWNCSDLDQMHSIQIMSFSREKAGDKALTQKNENLLARIIRSSSNEEDVVVDYFVGSGTTAAVAQKLRRKWIGIEVGANLFEYAIPRLKRVLGGDPYGISSEVNWKGGGFFKYICLESYEDTLNNLHLRRTEDQADLLDNLPPSAKDDYLLHYMLDIEGRSSLLSVEDFRRPFDYTMNVATDSAGAYERRKVDLVETFNYLIGLQVEQINAQPERGFTTVAGKLPNGDSCLVLWRDTDLVGYEEVSSLCDELGITSGENQFDVVYINGDHNIPSVLSQPAEEGGGSCVLNIRQIEPEFLDLMFNVEDV